MPEHSKASLHIDELEAENNDLKKDNRGLAKANRTLQKTSYQYERAYNDLAGTAISADEGYTDDCGEGSSPMASQYDFTTPPRKTKKSGKSATPPSGEDSDMAAMQLQLYSMTLNDTPSSRNNVDEEDEEEEEESEEETPCKSKGKKSKGKDKRKK